MAFVVLKTCCGIVSVKTGAYFISLLNLVLAVIAFVAYVSITVIELRSGPRHIHDDGGRTLEDVLVIVNFSVGMCLTATHIGMGSLLIKGLRMEDTRYLRRYLIICSVDICLTLLLVASYAIFLNHILFIIVGIGIVLEGYFMLVIHSAYRVMIQEEKTFAAARNAMDDRRTDE